MHRISQGDLVLPGWYYPPTLALLFQFLALVSTKNTSIFWTSFNVVGMFCCSNWDIHLIISTKWLRIMIPDIGQYIIFIFACIKWGQISLWLTVLCWYALYDTSKESSTSGLLIGITGLVNLSTFSIYLLPNKRYVLYLQVWGFCFLDCVFYCTLGLGTITCIL